MSTEELSLIVAGLAVVVGPAITYRLGVRRFDHERRQDSAKFAHERRITDLADVRSALSGGALALHMAKEEMRTQLTDFDQPLSTGQDWPDDFRDRVRELERRRDEIEAALAALQIRLIERAPVVVALSEAWKTLRALISVYTIAYGHRGPAGASARERKDDHGEAWGFSVAFDGQHKAYLQRAQELAGAKLGERPEN